MSPVTVFAGGIITGAHNRLLSIASKYSLLLLALLSFPC